MKKIQIDFEIGDKVKIEPLECTGRVVAIFITQSGTKYDVRYFDKAEAKNVYFYPDELSPVE